jgi:hypothetical protein
MSGFFGGDNPLLIGPTTDLYGNPQQWSTPTGTGALFGDLPTTPGSGPGGADWTSPATPTTPATNALGGATTASNAPASNAPAATTSSGSDSVFSITGWANWLGGLASRAGLILLAIVLLLGAVYLFAQRTQQITAS